MLRGHLPVFHDLLDLGSFVLKPDFHLGGGTKAHVTGTFRGCPRLSLGGERRLFWPLDYPVPVSPSSCPPIASTLDAAASVYTGSGVHRKPWPDQRHPASARVRPQGSSFILSGLEYTCGPVHQCTGEGVARGRGWPPSPPRRLEHPPREGGAWTRLKALCAKEKISQSYA